MKKNKKFDRKLAVQGILKSIPAEGVEISQLNSRICYSYGIPETLATELVRVLSNTHKIIMREHDNEIRWFSNIGG